MLLSRAFCLILGTTLFVLIWTMQDGNHRPTQLARSSRSRVAGPAIQSPAAPAPKVKAITVAHKPAEAAAAVTTVNVTTVKKSADSMLWMFADEEPATRGTQIAAQLR
jgi:hypothetical protein